MLKATLLGTLNFLLEASIYVSLHFVSQRALNWEVNLDLQFGPSQQIFYVNFT